MIDTIPTFAWSCFKDGSVEFLNKRWLEFTGLSVREAAGWAGSELLIQGIWKACSIGGGGSLPLADIGPLARSSVRAPGK